MEQSAVEQDEGQRKAADPRGHRVPRRLGDPAAAVHVLQQEPSGRVRVEHVHGEGGRPRLVDAPPGGGEQGDPAPSGEQRVEGCGGLARARLRHVVEHHEERPVVLVLPQGVVELGRDVAALGLELREPGEPRDEGAEHPVPLGLERFRRDVRVHPEHPTGEAQGLVAPHILEREARLAEPPAGEHRAGDGHKPASAAVARAEEVIELVQLDRPTDESFVERRRRLLEDEPAHRGSDRKQQVRSPHPGRHRLADPQVVQRRPDRARHLAQALLDERGDDVEFAGVGPVPSPRRGRQAVARDARAGLGQDEDEVGQGRLEGGGVGPTLEQGAPGREREVPLLPAVGPREVGLGGEDDHHPRFEHRIPKHRGEGLAERDVLGVEERGVVAEPPGEGPRGLEGTPARVGEEDGMGGLRHATPSRSPSLHPSCCERP